MKNKEWQKVEEKFCVFHKELTVATAIFLLGMVQPACHTSAKVAILQTTCFQCINKHPECCHEIIGMLQIIGNTMYLVKEYFSVFQNIYQKDDNGKDEGQW